MQIINSKNISLLSIFIVVILIFISAYYTSVSYRDYKELQRGYSYINLINRFDDILHIVGMEKESSAIYLGSQKKIDFKKVEQHRQEVRQKIEETIVYIEQDLKFVSYKKTLQKLLINLSYFWSKVDLLKVNYNEIFGEDYHNKILKSLLDSIAKISVESEVQKNIELASYIQLLKLEENLNMEKSFISYILSSSKKMSDLELLNWEKFVKNDVIPDFSALRDITLHAKLNNIIDPKYFSRIAQRERGDIFISSLNGRYTISIRDWLDVFGVKVDKILSARDTLLSTVKADIKGEIVSIKDELFNMIIIFGFFLLSLLILLYIYSTIDKNSRFLSETLKDIEADLDEKQKREIKEVIKKNDTIEIYKFLANAIKEPSRAKDHFLANMSHEIRTPLNGIIGFTNILKETELKEDQQEFIGIIEESSNNLIKIVDDILDFSKATSGKIEFENISFNVMEKFEASIDSYGAKATEKDIELGLYIDPELPMELMGDSTKISQIMINLLSNAIKFTDNGGDVTVLIEKLYETENDVKVKFSVKDSGIGVTKDQQSKIFDAFSQADVSTSRKFGGTGLGLTISSKFVSLMGGELDIESEEGKGATFFFSINLNKSDESTSRVVPNFNHLKVAYLAADTDDIREVDKNIETYVKYSGADFKKYSYAEIVNIDKNSKPDIIFIDHKAMKSEEDMVPLLQFNSKIVLLTTADIESCSCSIKDNISKIIYKPVNFSKTMRALKIVDRDEPCIVEREVEEINTIASDRVFKDIKALVVEDNIINQKLITRILNNFDITVTVANNGAEALKVRQESSFDIIFMDIQMPIMDGLESTEKIIEYEKANQQEHIPIVALTANTLKSDRDRYLASGMDKYLEKPINVGDLTAIIEEYFPIQEIRDSISLESPSRVEGEELNIILYKETPLTAKIYSAVLNNLGYKVDMYSAEDEFLEQLDNRDYKFALFDAKPFRNINTDSFVVDIIRDSGATPIAFVEKDNQSDYCETLKPVGRADEISDKLSRCG